MAYELSKLFFNKPSTLGNTEELLVDKHDESPELLQALISVFAKFFVA